VTKAFATNCAKCHGATPAFGAPMSLASIADYQKPSPTNAAVTVTASAIKRLNDTASPMPPGGVITPEDKKILNDWLAAGAPAGPSEGTCDTTGVPTVHDEAYFKNGLTPLPGETCYELQVHAGQTATDNSAYPVKTGEHYEQFYYKVPWKEGEVMTRYGSKFDNLKVVHHWLLFTSSMGANKVGTHETTIGSTIGDSSQLIAGWAVGGDHVTFPEGVALELTTAGILNAQWHYYNPTATPQMDHSLIQVCTVPRAMRPKVGSLTFLGTENFNGPLGMPPKTKSDFSGTCVNDSGAPITIFGWNPHMHKLGVHMKTTIMRKNGQPEVVFDKPFDFNSQITYILDKPLTLEAGESILSTCTFNNTTDASVAFGPSTEQEMCYNFTMSYPAKALDNGVPSLIGATNTCW
jgi:hypothetical protein